MSTEKNTSAITYVVVALLIVSIVMSGVAIYYTDSISSSIASVDTHVNALPDLLDDISEGIDQITTEILNIEIPEIPETPETPETPDAEPKIFKVGWVTALTGSAAEFGTEFQRIASLQVEIFNNAGGIPSGPLQGYKIDLSWADSGGVVEKSQSEIERFIVEEEVDLLIGCLFSSHTATVLPILEQYEIPMVADVSSALTLNRMGYTWYFRPGFHDEVSLQAQFQCVLDLQEEYGVEMSKLGLLYVNDENGVTAAEAVRDLVADTDNMEIVVDLATARDTTDWTSEVLALKAAGVDVLFMDWVADAGINLLRTLDQYDVNPKWYIGTYSAATTEHFMDSTGDLSIGLTQKALWNYDIESGISNYWDGLFMDRYGYHISDARHWLPLATIFKVVEEAGSLDPHVLQDTFYDIVIPSQDLITTFGVDFNGLDTDEPGMNGLAGGIVIQAQPDADGVLQWRTVWPLDQAPFEPIFPIP